MAKKEASADKLVKKVNKEIEKTSEKIETLISEALVQFDNIQGQLQEPVKKWIKEIEDLREREVKRFGDELEKRLNDLHHLQQILMNRLGFGAGSEGETMAREMDEAAHGDLNPAKSKAKKAAMSASQAASTIADAVNPASKSKKSTAKKTPAKKAAMSADEAASTIKGAVNPASNKPKKTNAKKATGKAAAVSHDEAASIIDDAVNPASSKPKKGSSKKAAPKKPAGNSATGG